MAVPQRLSQTTSLIICGRGNKFDGFIPDGKSVADSAFASLFLKQGNQTAIVIDMAATTLNVLNIDNTNDAATGTDSGTVSVEHDKQLYREYVRYLLSQTEPRFGAWLEEGLSQIIMKMQFDRKWIEFAKLEDPNTISAQGAMIAQMNAAMTADDPDAATFAGAPAEDRDFSAALRRRALIPLEKFFAIKHDSPEATNTLGNNRWGKQAYAFVHMCLYGYHGKYQKAFTTFMQRSAREPVTEAMFKECFNMSYSKMLMEIRSYCDFTVYESKYYKSKEDVIIPPPPLALRDATQSEIGRIKGEAMMLAGHKKAARAELIAPYQRGERIRICSQRSASTNETTVKRSAPGSFCRRHLPQRPRAPTRVSNSRASAMPTRWQNRRRQDGRFSGAQVNSVLEPLQQARRQPPPQPAVYDLVADTWMRSAVKPKHDDVVFVAEGAQLFPTRLKLVYQAAVVAGDAGELQAAHALADHGIKYGPDEKVKKRFEDLKATLPPAPPAPPEPEPAQTQSPPTAPTGAKAKAGSGSKK